MSEKASTKSAHFVSLHSLEDGRQTAFEYVNRNTQVLFRLFFGLTCRLIEDCQCARWRGKWITPDTFAVTKAGFISLPARFDSMNHMLRKAHNQGANFRQMMVSELPVEIQRWGRWYLSILFGLSDLPRSNISRVRQDLDFIGVFKGLRNQKLMLDELAVLLVRLNGGAEDSSDRYLYKYRTPYFLLQDLIRIHELHRRKAGVSRILTKHTSVPDASHIELFLRGDSRIYEGPQRRVIERIVGSEYSNEAQVLFSQRETEEEDIPSHVLPIIRQILADKPDVVVSLSKNAEVIGYGVRELMAALTEAGLISPSKVPCHITIIVAKEREISLGAILIGLLRESERCAKLAPEQRERLRRMFRSLKQSEKSQIIRDIKTSGVLNKKDRKTPFESLLKKELGEIVLALSNAFTQSRKLTVAQSREWEQSGGVKMLNYILHGSAAAVFFRERPKIAIIDDLIAEGSTLAMAKMVFEALAVDEDLCLFTLLLWPAFTSLHRVREKYGISVKSWGKFAAGRGNLGWLYFYASITPEWKSVVNPLDEKKRRQDQLNRVLDGDGFDASFFGRSLRVAIEARLKYLDVAENVPGHLRFDLVGYAARNLLTDLRIWAKMPLPWRQDERVKKFLTGCASLPAEHLISQVYEVVGQHLEQNTTGPCESWDRQLLQEAYTLNKRIQTAARQIVTDPSLRTLVQEYFSIPRDDRSSVSGLLGDALPLHNFIMWAAAQLRELEAKT